MSTRYVWGRSTPGYVVVEDDEKTVDSYEEDNARHYVHYMYADSYVFDPGSRQFTLKNWHSGTSTSGSGSIPAGKYFAVGFLEQYETQYDIWYAVSAVNYSYSISRPASRYKHTISFSGDVKHYDSQKGAGQDETMVSSNTSGQYPSNGVTGGYWYVSKGSDNIDPSALTYSDAVTAGQDVTLTIAPSTGTTLGGNISYVIQTTTNGTDWYDAGTTSGTTYTVTVPADAIVWNVRVYAKDDTGFTSSTYVYGNGVDTYVTVIRVGIAPDSGDIGYITSPQVMFVSINTDTDYTFTVKLDGETLSSSSSSSSTIQHIILSDEKFNSLEEDTKYTLTVEIVQSGATITRTYTFKKFIYDDTSLGGVFSGAAKALRIKRSMQTQIIGANIPKEIIKIDNPIGVSDLAAATASEAQVFKGYTFFSGDNELKTGIALGTETTATVGDILSGKTAYDNLGKLITGSAIARGTYLGTVKVTSKETTGAFTDYYKALSINASATLLAQTTSIFLVLNVYPFYGSSGSTGQTNYSGLSMAVADLGDVSGTAYKGGNIVYANLGTGGSMYVNIAEISYSADIRKLNFKLGGYIDTYRTLGVITNIHCYA